MSFLDFAVGGVLTVVCVAAVSAASLRLRRALLPQWSGAPARIVETIGALALVLLALQVVGILGVLGRAGIVVACLALAGVTWVAAGRAPSGDDVPAPAVPSGSTARLVALVAAGAVAAAWLARVFLAYRQGMDNPDTLWYHLPAAARFVQTGQILDLQYFDKDPVTVFYPANAVLYHAMGMSLFRSDILSPVLNIGWAALALVSAWVIGRPSGRSPHCVVALAVVLGTPTLVGTQPGGAYTDIVCIALTLAAVAILVTGGVRPIPSAYAAAAVALALGTKFTMVAPAGLLLIGVVVITPRGMRARQAGAWILAFLFLGGIWFIRNWVDAGNPLPSLEVGIGGLVHFPAPRVGIPTFTVAQYLTDGHVWHDYYVPGLRRALGFGWWAMILAGAAGAILALTTRTDRVRQMLAVVCIGSVVGYLATPQFLGLPGNPIYFVFNVRYAAVPIVLGLLLLATDRRLGAVRVQTGLLAGLAALLVLTEVDPSIWPTGIHVNPFGARPPASMLWAGLAAGAVLIAAGAWIAIRGVSWSPSWARAHTRLVAAGAVVALAVVVFGGWRVADSYQARRYTNTVPLPRIFAWAQNVRDTRIGFVGLVGQYPLTGRDGSNRVQVIGESQPNRGFRDYRTCRGWMGAVERGRYDWLVIAPQSFPLSRGAAPQLAWTLRSPAATAVISDAGAYGTKATLVRIRGRVTPKSCSA